MYLKLIFTCTFDTFVARKLLLILKKCHMLQSNLNLMSLLVLKDFWLLLTTPVQTKPTLSRC